MPQKKEEMLLEARDTILNENPFTHFFAIKRYIILFFWQYMTWGLVLWALGAFDKGDTDAASLHSYFNQINKPADS